LRRPTFTPFRSPAYRRLWLSTVITAAAQGVERTLTAWLALQLGADAFGLFFAARMLPSLLFGLPAGTIADRADRPRQLGAVALAWGYAAVALAYGLLALLIGTLRVAQDHRQSAAPPPFRRALTDSLRLIGTVPAVRTLIVAGLICEVLAFSHMTAIPLFAQNVLAAGPEGLGILNAALSIGGAIGVALLSLVPERVARQPLLGAVNLLYGAAIVGFGLSGSLVVATLLLLVTGFCAAAFDVLQQTLIQLAVPAEQRGRAMGLWLLSIGSAPIGHLEMGALSAALGVSTALLINGVLTIAAAVWMLAREPEYRMRVVRRA
jgi:MFS family permease